MCKLADSAHIVFSLKAPCVSGIAKPESKGQMLGHVKFDHCVPGEVIGPVQLQPLVMPQKGSHQKGCLAGLLLTWKPGSCIHQIYKSCHVFKDSQDLGGDFISFMELHCQLCKQMHQCFAFPSFCPKERLGLMRLVGAGEHG